MSVGPLGMSTFIVSHIIFHNSRYRYAAVSCMERYWKMLKPFFLYFQNTNCLFTVLSCEHNFSGKILYQLPLFPKFLKFWVNGKCPKCIQAVLVLRETSARTTMCKKVCCTFKLDLLTLALLITSPG